MAFGGVGLFSAVSRKILFFEYRDNEFDIHIIDAPEGMSAKMFCGVAWHDEKLHLLGGHEKMVGKKITKYSGKARQMTFKLKMAPKKLMGFEEFIRDIGEMRPGTSKSMYTIGHMDTSHVTTKKHEKTLPSDFETVEDVTVEEDEWRSREKGEKEPPSSEFETIDDVTQLEDEWGPRRKEQKELARSEFETVDDVTWQEDEFGGERKQSVNGDRVK